MMISRVAENCFWLSRYIERADTLARLVSVNRVGILDTALHEGQSWRPVVIISGEQKRFEELVGQDAYNETEKAEAYLTWEQANPASIYMSLSGARENARTTREVVSREMWETINATWRWLNSSEAKKLYRRDREDFYAEIRSRCAQFQGNAHDTMLHEEAFDFLKFGSLVERAAQTARVMDVKHHWLKQKGLGDYEAPQESAQWMGLLRLCSAVEPFFKRHTSAPTGPLVVRFLLQERAFPRSVLHSLSRVRNFLARIDQQTNAGKASRTQELALSAVEQLKSADLSSLGGTQLHLELTRIIEGIAEICSQASRDYFNRVRSGEQPAMTQTQTN